MVAGSWYHIVLQKGTGNIYELYINGTLYTNWTVGSSPAPSSTEYWFSDVTLADTLAFNTDWRYGVLNVSSGSISELVIHLQNLSKAEIIERYLAYKPYTVPH